MTVWNEEQTLKGEPRKLDPNRGKGVKGSQLKRKMTRRKKGKG